MSKVMVKTAVGLCLALVLLLSMTTLALAATGFQWWYLDSETIAAGYEMEKDTSPGNNGQTGSVTIAAGSSLVWLADEAAVCDVTFSGGSWYVFISTDSDWGTDGDMCEARVGGWDTTDGWYDIATITIVTMYYYNTILKVEVQAGAATIYQGDYLALEIKNNDSISHLVYTDGDSVLRSPDTDPGYPVAEVVSGALLGLGLVGLAGYAGWKRRKASKQADNAMDYGGRSTDSACRRITGN